LHNKEHQDLLFSFTSDQTFEFSKNQKMYFQNYDMNPTALYDTIFKLGSEESKVQVSCGYEYTVGLLRFIPVPMGKAHFHQVISLSDPETNSRRRLNLVDEVVGIWNAVFAQATLEGNAVEFPLDFPFTLKDFLPKELTSMVVHVPLVCEGVQIDSDEFGSDGWKFCALEQTIDLAADHVRVWVSVDGVDGIHYRTVPELVFNPLVNFGENLFAKTDFSVTLTPSRFVLLNDLSGFGNSVNSVLVRAEPLIDLETRASTVFKYTVRFSDYSNATIDVSFPTEVLNSVRVEFHVHSPVVDVKGNAMTYVSDGNLYANIGLKTKFAGEALTDSSLDLKVNFEHVHYNLNLGGSSTPLIGETTVGDALYSVVHSSSVVLAENHILPPGLLEAVFSLPRIVYSAGKSLLWPFSQVDVLQAFLEDNNVIEGWHSHKHVDDSVSLESFISIPELTSQNISVAVDLHDVAWNLNIWSGYLHQLQFFFNLHKVNNINSFLFHFVYTNPDLNKLVQLNARLDYTVGPWEINIMKEHLALEVKNKLVFSVGAEELITLDVVPHTGVPTRTPTRRPTRIPTIRPSPGAHSPTFAPTIATTRIEGDLTLNNINLAVLSTKEKQILEGSIRDGIAQTANVKPTAVKELTLTDSSTTPIVLNAVAKKNSMRTLVTPPSHQVVAHFVIEESSASLHDGLYSSADNNPALADCISPTATSLTATFQAILSCHEGSTFIDEFKDAVKVNSENSGVSKSLLTNLLTQTDSTSFAGVTTVDKSPTAAPTRAPESNSDNKNDLTILLVEIIVPVGAFVIFAACLAFYLFRHSSSFTGGAVYDASVKNNLTTAASQQDPPPSSSSLVNQDNDGVMSL
jgi:hypothetical protein